MANFVVSTLSESGRREKRRKDTFWDTGLAFREKEKGGAAKNFLDCTQTAAMTISSSTAIYLSALFLFHRDT